MKNMSKAFSSRSNMLRAALEDVDNEMAQSETQVQLDANQGEGGGVAVANEGFLGGVAGAGSALLLAIVSGTIGLPAIPVLAAAGAGIAVKVAQKQKEIENLSKQIKTLATAEGQRALKEGKISREDYKKNIDVDWTDIAQGAIFGGLFALIYGAIKGNQLQNKVEELQEKLKDLDAILKDAEANGAKKMAGSKAATENLEEGQGDPAAAAPEGDALGQTAPGVTEGQGDQSAADTPATDVAVTTTEAGDAAAASTDAPQTQAAAPAAADTNAAGADAQAAAVAEQGDVVAETAQLDVDTAEAEGIQEELDGAEEVGVAMEGIHRELKQISIAAAGLEALAITLDATKQVGGPSVHAAFMYQTGLETICDMLEVKKPFTPAMEAIEGADAKIAAADKASTAGKNLVQRMIEAMRAGLERFGKWVGNLWKFVTQAVTRTLARAKKMEAGLATAKFSQAPIKGGAANAVQDTMEFVQGFGNFAEVVKHFNQPQTYTGYIELMTMVSRIQLGNGREDEVVAGASAALDKLEREFGAGMQKQESGDTTIFSKALIGQNQLRIVVPGSIEQIGKFNTTVGLPQGVEAKKVEEVKPVAQNQAQQLLKQVIEALEVVAKTTSENGIAGVDDKLNQVAATFKNGGTPPADPEGRVAKAVKVITGLVSSRAKLPAYAINRSFVAAANTALNLISSSVESAAKKEAPAAAPAKAEAPAAA